MKKKIISAVIAAACMCSAGQLAMAAENNPSVTVNDRELVFADQKPVISESEGRTLVPARGVFEFMGAKVNWEADKQRVVIKQGNYHIHITIGSDVMAVYTYSPQNLLAAPAKEEIKLDAPARIMNERTMIPLRAISESLKAKVDWDAENNMVSIYTSDYKAPVTDSTVTSGVADKSEKNVTVSLSSSAKTVKAGETFDVIVSVDNIENAGGDIAGFAISLVYDHSKLEYVENSMKSLAIDVSNALAAENPVANGGDTLKTAVISTVDNNNISKNGEFVVYTFKALTDDAADIRLSNRYTSRGYDVMFTVDKGDKVESLSGDLYIDTTPVTINN